MTIYWTDADGAIVRATDDSATDDTLIAVKVPPNPTPESGEQKWLGDAWSSAPDRSASNIARINLDKDHMMGGVVVALAKRLDITEETLIDEIVSEVEAKQK